MSVDRTNFAGLTRLDPGDALESDGGSFLRRNIDTLDHFAQVGAVTHRHDGHVALATPAQAPSAVAASGGTFAAGLVMSFGYTLLDGEGGETLLSPLASAQSPGGLGAPDDAPAAAFDPTAGALPVGSYYYTVTLVDASANETTEGPWTNVLRPGGYASGRILISGLSAIATGGGATGWRLYRSFNGGAWGLLTSGDSLTDTAVDDGSGCADPTLAPPEVDGTTGTGMFTVTIPAQATGVTLRLYASDADFDSPALVTEIPIPGLASAIVISGPSDIGAGSPPPVATAKPGANKINALTDIDNLAIAVASAGQRTRQVWASGIALASGASGGVSLGASGRVGIAMASGFNLYRVETDRAARVRLYARTDHANADVARAVGVDPTEGGVIVDVVTASGALRQDLSPMVVGANLEDIPTAVIPANITNYGASGTVTVSLTGVPTE